METKLLIAAALLGILLIVNILLTLRNKPQNAAMTAVEKLNEAEERLSAQLKNSGDQQKDSERRLREELNIMRNSQELLTADANDKLIQQVLTLQTSNDSRLEEIRRSMDWRMQQLQESNEKRLEQMRSLVDEKLTATLEGKLNDSFRQVSERLEMVHQGLGEMQVLAAGVGDLKKVLSNIKTRGTWGEVQLGSLLEQMLAPSQYGRNIATKPSAPQNIVEFAVKLPGKEEKSQIWLPIDSKFPLADYQALLDAREKGDTAATENASRALERRIKDEAKDIRDKYLEPPATTDFGILFLPVEGLYSEILSHYELCEALQNEYRVTVAGPATLSALLNSLQMGFRTLAIEKRSEEVWRLLEAVRSSFVQFGIALNKTQKKLGEASRTLADASKKTASINKKLRNVSEMPLEEAEQLFQIDYTEEAEEDSEI